MICRLPPFLFGDVRHIFHVMTDEDRALLHASTSSWRMLETSWPACVSTSAQTARK
jgi:hypothetical protein